MPKIQFISESSHLDFNTLSQSVEMVREGCKVVSVREIFSAMLEIPKKYQRILVDKKYTIPTEDGLMTLLSHIQTKHFKYLPEFYDCDDFSRTFQALSNIFYGMNGVGVVFNFGEQHAYNLCFFSGKKGETLYHVVEPQADSAVQDVMVAPYKWNSNGLIII